MTIDKIRDIEELRTLFNQNPIKDEGYDVDFIVKNKHTYCFYDELGLIGCIFMTERDNKLYLNGFSRRKSYNQVKSGIIKVINHYKEDIYSETEVKSAIYALLATGFKKIGNNQYKRKYNG